MASRNSRQSRLGRLRERSAAKCITRPRVPHLSRPAGCDSFRSRVRSVPVHSIPKLNLKQNSVPASQIASGGNGRTDGRRTVDDTRGGRRKRTDGRTTDRRRHTAGQATHEPHARRETHRPKTEKTTENPPVKRYQAGEKPRPTSRAAKAKAAARQGEAHTPPRH